MSGIEEIPSNSRIMTPKTLLTGPVVMPTSSSGGTELSSGVVERVILRVPEMKCSGDNNWVDYTYSGAVVGVMIGGKTTNAPYISNLLSGEPFCVTSGKGLWLPVGSQKELYVQNLNEIRVCSEPSGYPVTFIAEVKA